MSSLENYLNIKVKKARKDLCDLGLADLFERYFMEIKYFSNRRKISSIYKINGFLYELISSENNGSSIFVGYKTRKNSKNTDLYYKDIFVISYIKNENSELTETVSIGILNNKLKKELIFSIISKNLCKLFDNNLQESTENKYLCKSTIKIKLNNNYNENGKQAYIIITEHSKIFPGKLINILGSQECISYPLDNLYCSLETLLNIPISSSELDIGAKIIQKFEKLILEKKLDNLLDQEVYNSFIDIINYLKSIVVSNLHCYLNTLEKVLHYLVLNKDK